MEVPTLYYHPFSYYSQKTEVDVKLHSVDLFKRQHLSKWFLDINNKGEVPVLKMADKYIHDSDLIIDVISAKLAKDNKLVPDIYSRTGREVNDLRQAIQAIPIDVITFGLLANGEVCVAEMTFPKHFLERNTRENIDSAMTKLIEELEEDIATSETDNLKQSYQQKLSVVRTRRERVLNKTEVVKCLYRTEVVFEKLQERLARTARECGGNPNIYLFETKITAADISAAVLFYRLKTLGVSSRYYSQDLRPVLCSYRDRMMKRPSVRRTILLVETMEDEPMIEKSDQSKSSLGRTFSKWRLLVESLHADTLDINN